MTVKPFSRLNYNARNYNAISATMVPVYSVSASSSSINEGTTVTYTITTQYVLDGTVLYWTTSGTTVAADFSDGLTSGSVTMTNGTATVTRTLTSDITTEGAETIVFELRTVSTSGTIVASTPSGTVNDTSVLTITPNVSSCNEGASVTWTINAVGFGTGTLYYTNSGTTNASDFSDNLNSGSIAITADSGTLTKTLQLDLSTEGSETIIIQIRTGSTSGTVVGTSATVTVADTSYSTQAYSMKFVAASTQYLTVPTSSFLTPTNTYTIEMWLNPTSYPGAGVSAGLYHVSNATVSNFGGLVLNFFGSGTIRLEVRPSTNGTNIQINSASVIPLNTWTHVAVVVNAGAATIYLNGVSSATGSVVVMDGTQTFCSIGQLNNGYTTNQTYYNGLISNFRILKNVAQYTAAFTPPTDNLPIISGTSLLLSGPTIADSSGNSLSITNNGTTVTIMENPFGNYSMSFNGSSQYLTAPANAGFAFGTGDFTVEFWVYMNAFSGSGTAGAFVGPWSGTASTSAWLFTQGNTTNSNLRFGVSDGTTATFYESSSTLALNQWFHVAAVRSSGTLKLYSNGIQVYSGALTQNISVSSQALQINGVAGATLLSNCYISNLRIVKGTAVYTAAFTPPTVPLTAITNTSFLSCQYAELFDVSTNHLAITNTGSTPATPQNPFGNYYTNFNGSSQYLTIPYNANQAFGTNNFTIEAWICPTITGQQRIISSWYGVGGQFIFELTAANKLNFNYVTTGNAQTSTVTTTGITTNVWTHIAVVRNGATITFYINGVADATTRNIGSGTSIIYYNSVQKDIGIGRDQAGTGVYFNGGITNLRMVIGTAVYTGAFTPSTTPLASTQSSGTNISAITGTATTLLTCQYADIVDASTNISTVTNSGSALTYLTDNFSGIVSGVNYAQKNYSLKLNTTSTNQYLTTTHASNFAFGTGDFTIESWIYLDNSYKSLSLESVAPVLWYGDSGSNIVGLFAQMGSDRLSISRPGYATNVYLRYPGATTGTPYLQYNTWYHLAITRQSATWKIFLNGVQGTTDSATDYSINTTSIAIGGTTSTSFAFPGYISNMRVVKGLAVYTGAFTPSTSPLKNAQSSSTNIAAITTQTSLLTCQYNTLFDASTNKLALTRVGAPDMVNMYPFPT